MWKCIEPNTGTQGSFLVIFGTSVTVVTFGAPVAFWYTRDMSAVFSTLGIITSEFWYVWFTLAHFTFGTLVGPVGTLLLVYRVAFWHTGIIYGHSRHVWYSRYVWYISCVWYTEDRISV